MMLPLFVYTTRRGAASWNMAVDEALLRSASSSGQAVLRFYSWKEPAATFGYFQHYADVEVLTALRPLVRRPTGGGIVPHDRDWTYSLAFPAPHPWYASRAEESYRQVHEWIQCAFARCDIKTVLAPCCSKVGPGQCFAGYEKHDLLFQGRKVAGAAQRRTKDGLLVQGSVQPPVPGISREQWENAMCSCGAAMFDFECLAFADTAEFSRLVSELETTKYSLSEYNRRR